MLRSLNAEYKERIKFFFSSRGYGICDTELDRITKRIKFRIKCIVINQKKIQIKSKLSLIFKKIFTEMNYEQLNNDITILPADLRHLCFYGSNEIKMNCLLLLNRVKNILRKKIGRDCTNIILDLIF